MKKQKIKITRLRKIIAKILIAFGVFMIIVPVVPVGWAILFLGFYLLGVKKKEAVKIVKRVKEEILNDLIICKIRIKTKLNCYMGGKKKIKNEK